MPRQHDNIIADAAKSALGPLGFQRKGRSRVWLADHGWWLTVVEFQPSSWSKGSYLNAAAHWLWSDMGHLSFDLGGRVAEFEEYISPKQFAVTASDLAARAADEAQRLAATFKSLSAAADELRKVGQIEHAEGRVGWATYHAGVSAGLVERWTEADEMFERATPSLIPASAPHSAAERMKRLLCDPPTFQQNVTALINQQRNALRLTQLNSPLL